MVVHHQRTLRREKFRWKFWSTYFSKQNHAASNFWNLLWYLLIQLMNCSTLKFDDTFNNSVLFSSSSNWIMEVWSAKYKNSHDSVLDFIIQVFDMILVKRNLITNFSCRIYIYQLILLQVWVLWSCLNSQMSYVLTRITYITLGLLDYSFDHLIEILIM